PQVGIALRVAGEQHAAPRVERGQDVERAVRGDARGRLTVHLYGLNVLRDRRVADRPNEGDSRAEGTGLTGVVVHDFVHELVRRGERVARGVALREDGTITLGELEELEFDLRADLADHDDRVGAERAPLVGLELGGAGEGAHRRAVDDLEAGGDLGVLAKQVTDATVGRDAETQETHRATNTDLLRRHVGVRGGDGGAAGPRGADHQEGGEGGGDEGSSEKPGHARHGDLARPEHTRAVDMKKGLDADVEPLFTGDFLR